MANLPTTSDLPTVHVECEVNDDAPFWLYTALERGEKTHELRLLLPTPQGGTPTKWWSLYPDRFAPGTSTLTVVCAGQPVRRFTRPIRSTQVAVGYRAMLDRLGHVRCIPGSASTEDAIKRVYKRFYPDKLEGYEVLAIELEPLARPWHEV